MKTTFSWLKDRNNMHQSFMTEFRRQFCLSSKQRLIWSKLTGIIKFNPYNWLSAFRVVLDNSISGLCISLKSGRQHRGPWNPRWHRCLFGERTCLIIAREFYQVKCHQGTYNHNKRTFYLTGHMFLKFQDLLNYQSFYPNSHVLLKDRY